MIKQLYKATSAALFVCLAYGLVPPSFLVSNASSVELLPEDSVNKLIFEKNIIHDHKNDAEKQLIDQLRVLRARVNDSAQKMSLDECLNYGIRRNYKLASAYALSLIHI